MKQFIPIGTIIYKQSIGKSSIDFVFAIRLLLESLISCKIVEQFDYDLDRQLIFSQ